MSNWEDEVNRHTAELVKLTMKAADQGPVPLPEDEVVKLGWVIATERQLLIDAMSGLLSDDDPEAGATPDLSNDYYEWTITPDPGLELDVTGLAFTFRSSATGPDEFQVRISVDAFAAPSFAILIGLDSTANFA